LPQLYRYRKDEVPRDVAVQIASYVRFQWPAFAGRKSPLWESLYPTIDRTHFVLVDGDVLVSHAIAHGRPLAHGGRTWNVWGLSSVFTYPTHRGSGFGEQVVAAATSHIRSQPDADFALLFCGERVKSLYLRQGWEHLPAIRVTFGAGPAWFNDGHVMTLLLSGDARAHDFSVEPIHVGPNTW
jgi:GNAT superfamily N-acetyltransferase